MQKYIIKCRKVYDDNTCGNWKRYSSKVYLALDNAHQAINALKNNYPYWGFDFDCAKMWRMEFMIEEKVVVQ